jgi:adenosylhomocysteine nucleosidase
MILVCMAMREEERGELAKLGAEVIFTGLGKINATYALTKALAERNGKVSLVVNFGTAGSHVFPAKELIACTSFVQRDMDVTPIGFTLGETPFDEVGSKSLFVESKWPKLPIGICGTGDNFAVEKPELACDVIDMEAYALAKVCARERVSFACAKYITDGADGSAHLDWLEHLPSAAVRFAQAYLELTRD